MSQDLTLKHSQYKLIFSHLIERLLFCSALGLNTLLEYILVFLAL